MSGFGSVQQKVENPWFICKKRCKQFAELWQPEQSFISVEFKLSLPSPDPCGSEIPPTERDRLRPSTPCATLLII